MGGLRDGGTGRKFSHNIYMLSDTDPNYNEIKISDYCNHRWYHLPTNSRDKCLWLGVGASIDPTIGSQSTTATSVSDVCAQRGTSDDLGTRQYR